MNINKSLYVLIFILTATVCLSQIDTVYFNSLSDKFRSSLKSDIDSAKHYTEKINRYAVTHNYKKGIGFSHNCSGICEIYAGNFDSAIVEFNKAAAIYTPLKLLNNLCDTYSNLGICYDYKGDPAMALNYYIKSLTIAENTKDEEAIAKSCNNIGTIYFQDKKYRPAVNYFYRSLSIREALKDNYGIASCCLNISACLGHIHMENKVPYFIEKCIRNAKIAGDSSLLSDAYISKAENMVEDKEYSAALEIYKRALVIQTNLDDPRALSIIHLAIGTLQKHLNDHSTSLQSFRKSYDLAKKINYIDGIMQSAYYLASAYAYAKLPDSTTAYIEIYKNAGDSLHSESNAQQLAEMQTKYETEKKNEENKLLQIKNALAEQSVKRQQNIIILVCVILMSVVISAIVIYTGYKNKKAANKKLSELNSEISLSKTKIETQHTLLEEKQKEIFDSINYAKRLQEAILPADSMINDCFKENFIFYKPKDIVAGDFYWLHVIEEHPKKTFIAAADCTGHGVPGALVSVVCSNALNRAVVEFGITDPGKLLDKTRELILETFSKSSTDVKDGMDISVCCMEAGEHEEVNLTWAGAHNPLLYTTADSLHTIAANKQPVGRMDDPAPFTTHRIVLQKHDTVYLITDGMADQFGGPKGKKYKSRKLKELLTEMHSLPMQDQKRTLENSFNDWKGNLEQVDDVTVIGIRL